MRKVPFVVALAIALAATQLADAGLRRKCHKCSNCTVATETLQAPAPAPKATPKKLGATTPNIAPSVPSPSVASDSHQERGGRFEGLFAKFRRR